MQHPLLTEAAQYCCDCCGCGWLPKAILQPDGMILARCCIVLLTTLQRNELRQFMLYGGLLSEAAAVRHCSRSWPGSQGALNQIVIIVFGAILVARSSCKRLEPVIPA